MTNQISGTLQALIHAEIQKILEAALQPSDPTTPTTIPDLASQEILAGICSLNTKIGKIMATLADIQSVLAANEASETKLITLLQTMSANNASLTTQLAAALAANDPVALQAIVTQMTADQATMDAAVAAAIPPGATPPGTPVIS